MTPALYVEPTSVGAAVRQRDRRRTTQRYYRVQFSLGFQITREMLSDMRTAYFDAYGLCP